MQQHLLLEIPFLGVLACEQHSITTLKSLQSKCLYYDLHTNLRRQLKCGFYVHSWR